MDEHLAVPGVLKEVIRGDREEGADALSLPASGDPGLQAAREVTSKPVLGICESAIHSGKIHCPYFSIVSVLDRSRKVTEDVVANYGAEKFCRSIRSTGLSVLEFGRDPQRGWRLWHTRENWQCGRTERSVSCWDAPVLWTLSRTCLPGWAFPCWTE